MSLYDVFFPCKDTDATILYDALFFSCADAGCEDAFLHGIRGLLRVYDNEMQKKDEVSGGLQECQKLCTDEPKCRAIGYAVHLSELDLNTGLYFKKEKQCWIYFRSTSTATVHTPNGMSGDLMVYDRKCY
ncbi:hypothetical protein JTE90_023536 [Oedothorax gibbosus]|uniref:Apple domain-containing protein n=1 Tax=Oedothorax gibbosus TaxID=931172 RepID=A0AAV6UJE8_9ARAC|nr:hypothetical protein JTE90_023536 [Oedothorax gibbosus]